MGGRFSGFAAGLAIVVAACGDSFTAATPAGDGDASVAGDGAVDGSAGDGGVCSPKTCPDRQWSCGTGEDGCGGTLDCGHCHVANFACVNHRCDCAPKSCTQLGYECGKGPDGCGGTASCGSCPTGQTCGGGGDHLCGTGQCTPKTCASAGVECGVISDGCGGQIDCGACSAPKTCGGSGVANHCGCVPKTCAQLGWECGSGADGCGGTLVCPACGGGTCDAEHKCLQCTPTVTCKSKGYTCGTLTNDCGDEETCGPTPTRDASHDSACSSTAGHPAFYACPSCGVLGLAPRGPTPNPSPDASTCGVAGPTPPVPGWDCVATGALNLLNPGWCCAQ